MCGFVGQISDNKQEKDEQFISDFKKSVDLIIYRGPNSDGYFHDEYCSLGFRRLSIIDVEGGSQPIRYDNGRYTLVFNGEIYNYLEIRSDLEKEGYKFETNSDSEVLLLSYVAYGKECVKKFRGMFGFLIYDNEEKTLFGARDMFGIKPMYYAEKDGVTYFASEKKSILELTKINEINKTALQYYFDFRFVPEPLTMHEGIYRLAPGHLFIKKINEPLVIEEYWDAEFSNDYFKTEEEAIEEIRRVLNDSMKYHLRSDVPVGALLSSGIDSTITSAIAKDYVDDIKTFTIGFDVGEKNETPIAKESAKAMGVENYSMTVDANEYKDALMRYTFNMDDPLADPSAVALYFVTRLASEHVTVIISGEGSDELFTGYKMYRQPLDLKKFKYVPFKKAIKKIVQAMPDFKGKHTIIRGLTDIRERYVSNTRAFEDQNELKKLLKNYDDSLFLPNVVKPHYDKAGKIHDVSKMQYVDLKMWMTGDILLKADRMSMSNSLELRVPFLDKEVFRVASRINPEWNVKENTTKRILRLAARGIIPDIVLDRPKLGFPVPMADWLRTDLKDWAMDLIDNSPVDEYINKDYVRELYKIHLSGEKDLKSELWAVITFMLWHKVYIEDFEGSKISNAKDNEIAATKAIERIKNIGK
ncbi:MAG: asparagine synthase (glutamine-hydrolyzing) [Clostridia bacterium]|nr:asparagine synthase (glutamine-hydrolyzing) [Clostridia bacterium]